MCENSQEGLDRGLAVIEQNYKRSSAYKKGKLTDEGVAAKMAMITSSLDPSYAALAECDAVIEAVFENLDLKKEIFTKLDKVCKPNALLCSNTSYLDVDQIANATSRPEWVMGTHFFSPAQVMPLLENVRGTNTSNAAIATAMKMGKDIGKTPVLVGNVSRVLKGGCFEF